MVVKYLKYDKVVKELLREVYIQKSKKGVNSFRRSTMDYIFVIVTAASEEEGEKIGTSLVKEELAACCNIIPNVKSVFQWKGEVSTEKEVILFIKSKASLFNRLRDRIKELHSYEVPEIIAFPISQGLPDYFRWMDDVIKA